MKRIIASTALIVFVAASVLGQICSPQIVFLTQITATVAAFESQGCTDLRVRRMNERRGLWEIRQNEVIMPSSVLVSGAGTSALNGTYTYRGLNDGKPYYNLTGSPDSIITDAIVWNINEWVVGGTEFNAYTSGEDVAFPWLVAVWDVIDGSAPTPTLTEVPVGSFPPNVFAKQAVKRASTY